MYNEMDPTCYTDTYNIANKYCVMYIEYVYSKCAFEEGF